MPVMQLFSDWLTLEAVATTDASDGSRSHGSRLAFTGSRALPDATVATAADGLRNDAG